MSGMLRVEDDEMTLRLYWVAARQVWRLARLRARFLWKVARGRYELTDAMHDLSLGRATAAVFRVMKAARRLRMAPFRAADTAEIDVLRMAFRAEVAAFLERHENNDFYQDSERWLGARIRFKRRERA